jgi:thiamine transport system permease protein
VTSLRSRRTAPSSILAIALGAAVPVAFIAAFLGWPVLRMLGLGLLPEGRLDLAGALDALLRERTLRLIGLTLGQAAAATAITAVLALPAAFVLYRLRFRGRGVLRALVIVPFVLPTVVVGIAFRILFRDGGPLGALGWDGSVAAILCALVFFNIAVVVRTVGGAWEGLDPRAEEAARALGASRARAFLDVTLPRLAPSLVSAAAVVFLFCATAFGVVLVLGGPGTGTIETEIYVLTTQFLDLQGAAVLSILQLLVVVLALSVAARARAAGDTAQRRVAHAARAPRRRDAPVILATVVVAALLLLPIVTLVVRSLRTLDGWGLDNYLALGGSNDVMPAPVWQAVLTSLTTAGQAVLIAVPLALCAALVLSRRPRSAAGRRLLAVLDGALMLPLGISAVTVGFGFLIALDRPPLDLRDSPLLIPIAHALVALPLVLRTVLPVLRFIDPRLREAAAALGAPPWRVLLGIDLAIAARPALAAAGLAGAVSLGEFGATTFLARPDGPTLPVVIVRLLARPGGEHLGMAIAASVVLAAITVLVMALVERLRVDSLGAF